MKCVDTLYRAPKLSPKYFLNAALCAKVCRQLVDLPIGHAGGFQVVAGAGREIGAGEVCTFLYAEDMS